MKKIILSITVLSSTMIYSQVGINNSDPKATMDILAKTTDGSKPEGLIAPRLTGNQIRLGNAQYTAAQAGTIIYASAADTAPAGKTVNITTAGYYYFDGSVWQKVITGSTVDTTNDAWVNNSGSSRVELGTQSNGSTARTAGTEFVALDNGNVGIGNSNPGVRLAVTAAGDMNGININNTTSTAGTRTRLGIGAGTGNWSALYYTNVSTGVGRFGIGDYVTSTEYLSIPMSGTNQGNVGIGTTSPAAKLDINGNLRIGTAVSTSGSTNVSSLVRDNTTGEIKVSTSSTGNTSNITFIAYNLSNVNGDWVNNFNTNIPTSQYTVTVIGSTFDKQGLATGIPGATYNPLNVAAIVTGSTWSLQADYSGGSTADGSNGTWTIYCMVVNNSIAKTLPAVNANLGGTNSGSAAIPAGL